MCRNRPRNSLQKLLLLTKLLLLLALGAAWCLRVDEDSNIQIATQEARVESSWRVVTTTTTSKPRLDSADTKLERAPSARTNVNFVARRQDQSRTGKLVEWDDDDHEFAAEPAGQPVDNSINASEQSGPKRNSPGGLSDDQSGDRRDRPALASSQWSSSIQTDRVPSTRNTIEDDLTNEPRRSMGVGGRVKLNKLIYHGQLRANNVAKRMVDGSPLYINTHKPVAISRRSFPAIRESAPVADLWAPTLLSSNKSSTKLPINGISLTLATRVASRVEPPSNQPGPENVHEEERLADSNKIAHQSKDRSDVGPDKHDADHRDSRKGTRWATQLVSQSTQESFASSSNWRPLVVLADSSSIGRRSRRSGAVSRRNDQPKEPLAPHSDENSRGRQNTAKAWPAREKEDERQLSVPFDFKWKPISLKGDQLAGQNLSKSSAVAASDSDRQPSALFDKFDRRDLSAFYSIMGQSQVDGGSNSRSSSRKQEPRARRPDSSIEQPFDEPNYDERSSDSRAPTTAELGDDNSTSLALHSNSTSRNLEPLANQPSLDKWRPLEEVGRRRKFNYDDDDEDLAATSSTAMPRQLQPSTTPSPLTPTNQTSSGANASETAQRSASDLNYIYSQQPLSQQASSSYYSNYLVPASNVQPQPPQTTFVDTQVPAIVDTTSGQVPEMIADRAPDQPPQQQQQVQASYDYSVPQQVAAFQPVQPPPIRQPPMPAYGYHEQPQFNQAPPPRQQYPQPVQAPRQPQQQASGSGQVVRQEHHYHYYNQQQSTPAPERTQLQGQAQTSIQQQPASQTIIRELQPIILQQGSTTTSTTTPAPQVQQIIREIVKEVPMVQMPFQLARIVVPPSPPLPPPVPVPQIPRDILEASAGYATSAGQAQRLIRTLSNTIPQVAIRMPSLPQFRLQMPSIQLTGTSATRTAANQAPVTRQTGSFLIPPMPKKTTTYLTETQVMPCHTTIMQTTQFTPATRTTVYTTDHQPMVESAAAARELAASSYKSRKR